MRNDWDDREDQNPDDARKIRKEFILLVGLGIISLVEGLVAL